MSRGRDRILCRQNESCDRVGESNAAVAKLVDALRSGRSGGNLMEVQIFSPAHYIQNTSKLNRIGTIQVLSHLHTFVSTYTKW